MYSHSPQFSEFNNLLGLRMVKIVLYQRLARVTDSRAQIFVRHRLMNSRNQILVRLSLTNSRNQMLVSESKNKILVRLRDSGDQR